MWIYTSLYLLICLDTVISRDVGKTLSMKTIPYVTNSLVNLGKMDISFHFNAHKEDLARSGLKTLGSSSMFSSKLGFPIDESCPCSSLTYLKDSSQNHPFALLSKIVSGNDLFSFKEPTSSPTCCESHEHAQEDVLFEFGPKQSHIIVKPQSHNSNPLPLLPILFDSFNRKPTLPNVTPKPKGVEIFFFPKQQGILPKDVEKLPAKKIDGKDKMEKIKIVGDKEMKNDFKAMTFVPPLPSSVKKDLALQVKSNFLTKNNDIITATDKHLNTVV